MKLAPVRIADDKYPTSVISVPKEHHNGTFYHPTQKPVALIEYLIRTYTDEGDTVLDNCIGSGTTAVAALRTGRQPPSPPCGQAVTTSASRQTAAIAGLRSDGYGKRLNRGKEKITRKTNKRQRQ